MSDLQKIKNVLASYKEQLSQKYALRFIAIFGSYARGQQNENSDIDILVDFKKPIGIEFIDLAHELEKILNLKVDLVSKNGVKPLYFKKIEAELTYV